MRLPATYQGGVGSMEKRKEERTLEEMLDYVKRYEQRQRQSIRSINIENLQQGINHLCVYVGTHKVSWWNGDFHNSLYQSLEYQRRRGLHEDFWRFLVQKLVEWKAHRNQKGITKQDIYTRGCERLDRLRNHYTVLLPHCTEPDYDELSWVNVSPLFEVASEIKPVEGNSPVFPSKLCHFLCPSIYPVFDNTLVKTGKIEYEVYWNEFKEQWEKASEKVALIEELKGHFPKAEAPCDHYPWPTKIFELCQY
jgi:hypothetical protein